MEGGRRDRGRKEEVAGMVGWGEAGRMERRESERASE